MYVQLTSKKPAAHRMLMTAIYI